MKFIDWGNLTKSQKKRLNLFAKKYMEPSITGKLAVIDSVIKKETNNLKLYKANVARFVSSKGYCVREERYIVTNAKDEIIFLYPDYVSDAKTKINSDEFINYKEFGLEALSTDELTELSYLKNYITNIENKKYEDLQK